jgi:alpha-1,6-mannosyltransferase
VWVPATALACLAGLAVQAGNLLYLAPHSVLTPGVRRAAHMYVDWPDYSWLSRYMRAGDVVLTPDDYFAIRTVPAYGGRTVAPAWPDPFLPDEAQRDRDLVRMRDPATDATTRSGLLARYHVRWVLEVPGRPSIEDGQTPVATGPQGQRLYAR